MMDLGHKMQDDSITSLQNAIGVSREGIQLADEINKELNDQILQLDRMNDTVRDIQSDLEKTKK